MARAATATANGSKAHTTPLAVQDLDLAAKLLKIPRQDIDLVVDRITPWPGQDGTLYWSLAQLHRQLVLEGKVPGKGKPPALSRKDTEAAVLHLETSTLTEVAKAYGISSRMLQRAIKLYDL